MRQVWDCADNDVAAPELSDIHTKGVTWLAYITAESSKYNPHKFDPSKSEEWTVICSRVSPSCLWSRVRFGKMSPMFCNTKQPERFTSVMKNTVFWLRHSFTLKMEVVESSETSADFYWATRCHVASISHISVLLIVHPVSVDNPIHHFRWRKGKSLTKECNILRYSHKEGELNACPTARGVQLNGTR